ncbi:hypothetical protein GQ53DRAFT_788029 [Thozetella sp. PMI_491]|nr:hypothetical protein GQ53DRAFT_788029 [Thozetella sp. PMI_491]
MDAKPGYETVSLNDDHEEARSSTEVDESLMGDDKEWHPSRRTKKRTCMTVFNKYRWMIDTFLLLVIVSLLVLLRNDWAARTFPKSSFQVGGDFTGAGPQFETKIVKFDQNNAFIPTDPHKWFNNETLNTWAGLLPASTGWGKPGEVFSATSMTHQLHCLFMMGRIFSAMLMNQTETLPSHFLPNDWEWHFMHCIDYMRQSVMCSADVTLEPHQPDEPQDTGPLDGGWNGRHVCKNYGQVIDYLEGQINDGVRVVLPIDD